MTGRTPLDSRDIFPIAAGAELAAKVLRDRGERAWKRSASFDPGAPTTRPADVAGGGTRVDEEGIPIVTSDRIGDQVAAAEHQQSTSSRAELARALRDLDTATQRVIDLVDSLCRTHTAAPPEDPRGWCPNCRKAGVNQPSAMRDDGSRRFRDRLGRCRPCINFHEQHGFDRPALIIQRKAEGRPLSQHEADQAIARARREYELDRKKAAARAARKRAEEQEERAS